MPIDPTKSLADAAASLSVQRGSNTPPGARRGVLPSGAPLSTLQTLSPEQLAALGVVAAVGTGFWSWDSPDDVIKPGDVLSLASPNGDGTYGAVGVEYQAEIFLDPATTVPTGGSRPSLFGPVTPTLWVSSNGNRKAWQFDGFDNQGQPFTALGPVSSSKDYWEGSEPEKYFKIYLEGDPLKEPIPENQGLPSIVEIPYPLAPEIADLEQEEEEENFRDRATDALNDIGNDLQELAELVGDIKETLETKLACNPCELIAQNELRRIQDHQETTEGISELEVRTRVQILETIDVAECGEEPQLVVIQREDFQGVVELLAANVTNLGIVKGKSCSLENIDVAVPESFVPTKAAHAPQVVLRMRESPINHPSTPRNRDIVLPYFVGDIDTNFPTWTRGPYKGTAKCAEGSFIKIFASSESECMSVLDSLGAKCTGYDSDSRIVSKGAGWVTNEVALSPFKVLRFPNGQGSGIMPSEVFNIETGERWP